MELIEVIRCKLHGIKITMSDLNYHGSITIDSDIIRAVGFLPLEFVHIWNKNSGARISTYVLPGEAGSGVVCLNGAAARSCQVGDEVIVSSWRNISIDELGKKKARILTFDHSKKVNSIKDILEYNLTIDKLIDNPEWSFKIENVKD